MSTSPKIYETKCPSCGAPLQMTGERTVCNYCGSVLEREHRPRPEPEIRREAPVVIIQSGHTSVSRRPGAGGSSCLSGLLTLGLVVGLVALIGWFQFPEQTAAMLSQAGLSNLSHLAQLRQQLVNKVSVTALSRVLVMPGGNEAAPDF